MNKIKRRYLITLGIVVIGFFLCGLVFCNFTKLGYMLTIRLHGFTEVRDNIFVDKSNLDDVNKLLSLIDNANNRLENFWGELKSSPTIIIAYKEKKLNKLGYTEAQHLQLHTCLMEHIITLLFRLTDSTLMYFHMN